MSYLPPSTLSRCGRRSCATATPIRRFGARGRPRRSRASMPLLGRATRARGRFPPTRSSSTSAWNPTCSRPARAIPTSRRRSSALVATTQANKRALVHGDVSPKNILLGPDGPVFLDAECAWWGDPAFDLAFCLNHLLLKCLWTPSADRRLSSPASTRSPRAYLAGVDWEPPRGAGSPRGRALLPGPVPRQGRWQVAGRVHHRRGATRNRVRRAATRAAAPHPVEAPRRRRAAWREGASRDDRHARSPSCMRRRVWDSRGRPTVEAEVAARRRRASAARSCRPAPPPAPARRSTCATAATAFGGYDVTRAVGHVNGEIARARRRHATPPTRPRSTAA